MFRLIFIITLTICVMQVTTNAPLNNDDGFRLLSINAASKILGIRHQTTTDLIKEGKIKIININGRIKIPRKNLDLFIETESRPVIVSNDFQSNIKSPQSMKYILNSIINKHK